MNENQIVKNVGLERLKIMLPFLDKKNCFMWYNHVLLFNIQGATTFQGLSRANQGQSFSFFWFFSYISKESKS